MNTALTKADFAPVRISSRLVRSPSTALMASMTMDLPAPVSPVDVEARIELDIGPLDDRDILNVKQRKHLCPS